MKKFGKAFIYFVMMAILFCLLCPAAIADNKQSTEEELGYVPAAKMLNADGESVNWNDNAFYQAIFGASTKKQLASSEFKMVWFRDPKQPVSDLSGLQFVTALEHLGINSNRVKNLNVLSTIKKLNVLYLENLNAISLEPLVSCKKLEELYLINCDELNLEPLSRCKNLKTVILKGKNITDESLSWLSQLSKLTQLSVSNSSITNLNAIGDMPKLKGLTMILGNDDTFSNLDDTASAQMSMTDYSPLENLKKLNMFSIEGIDQKTLIAVLEANQKNLEQLALVNVELDEAGSEAVRRCTKLTQLKLTNCTVNNWPADMLAKMKKLVNISLRKCDFADLSWMSEAKALEKFEAILCSVDNLNVLEKAQKMKVMMIVSCKVGSFDFLENLTCDQTLIALAIGGSKLEDVGFVARYPKLRELYLDGNEITSIEPLANAEKIVNLSLYDNPINDYSPIQKLSSLWQLYHNENVDLKQYAPMCYQTSFQGIKYREIYQEYFGEAEAASENK